MFEHGTNQTLAMGDVDTVVDNTAEQEDSCPRGKVPRLDESCNRRNTAQRSFGRKVNVGRYNILTKRLVF